MREACESELKRGAGQFVDLIEILCQAHLLRRGDKDARKKQQAVVAKSQRGPRPD